MHNTGPHTFEPGEFCKEFFPDLRNMNRIKGAITICPLPLLFNPAPAQTGTVQD
jgi:hypothetical protein